MKTKNVRQLERHFKGVANHHRLDILLLIAAQSGINLDAITKELKGNPKTIGEHTRRLFIAGLISKKYQGHSVEHRLSPYGEIFYKFIKSFSSS